MAACRALAAALLRSTARPSSTGLRSAFSPSSTSVGSGSGSAPFLRVFSMTATAPHEKLMDLARAPILAPVMLGSVRHFAKRAKKWQGSPYVWLPIPAEGEEIPDSRPNKGSVKNRNHQKRMAQRMEFAKMQAHVRREQKKVVVTARDTARRKRWKEGAERAKAWAQVCAERAAKEVSVVV